MHLGETVKRKFNGMKNKIKCFFGFHKYVDLNQDEKIWWPHVFINEPSGHYILSSFQCEHCKKIEKRASDIYVWL